MLRMVMWGVVCGALSVFAVANRERVEVRLDPFISPSIEVPVYMVVLGGVFLGVILGGSAAWLRQWGWRRRVRRGGR